MPKKTDKTKTKKTPKTKNGAKVDRGSDDVEIIEPDEIISPSVEDIKTAARLSFGNELIRTLNERPFKRIEGISWGCPSLNYNCTGNPFVGLVRGRTYEIFGEESSGKTTLCLHAIAQAQSADEIAAFVDAEQALDVEYAENLGINQDKLLFTQPDYGEQALDVVEKFVDLGVRLIVVDSAAALLPLDELEANMEKAHIGLQARMMSKFLRKTTPKIAKSNSTVLFINQTRQKIGVMFGNPETTPGGNALKFYSSIRLRCSLSTAAKRAIKGSTGSILDDEDKKRLGSIMTIRIPKNKVAPPFRECEIPLYYGKGLDLVKDWYVFALKSGLIKQGKGTYVIPQSKNNGVRVSYDNLTKHLEEIKNLIRIAYKR